MTHFERIKQMSINEIAEFLFVHQFAKCSNCDYYGKQCSGRYFDDFIERRSTENDTTGSIGNQKKFAL